MFRGSNVAIVTPFKEGRIHREALRGLVRFHLEAGTHGIVACGTTGEGATLSFEETKLVGEIVMSEVDGKIPVILGTGKNCTSQTVELTRMAKDIGCDGALIVTPYYNKPTQEGLYQHYRTVAEAVDIPIILYNVPGRTSINLEADTAIRLSEIENIVALKEASGDLVQISEIIRICGDALTMLSGDDFLVLPTLAVGGEGVISVVANVAPGKMAKLYTWYTEGEIEGARSMHYQLLPLSRAMFLETNPIPVKTALGFMGMIEEEFRQPLWTMGEANKRKLRFILEDCGIMQRNNSGPIEMVNDI